MPHLVKHREKVALAGKFYHAVAVFQNVGHGCRKLIGKPEFIPRFSLFTRARKALPELITTIVATIKKDASIAIGNLVGSCMLNLWLILGIGSIITPLEVSIEFNFNLILLLFSTTLVLIFSHYIGKNNVITKIEGTILILVFIVYIISLIVY